MHLRFGRRWHAHRVREPVGRPFVEELDFRQLRSLNARDHIVAERRRQPDREGLNQAAGSDIAAHNAPAFSSQRGQSSRRISGEAVRMIVWRVRSFGVTSAFPAVMIFGEHTGNSSSPPILWATMPGQSPSLPYWIDTS
jgi:hypothetical protein